MNFGDALHQLKRGARVTRSGWNGADMWVVMRAGYPAGVPIDQSTADAVGFPPGTVMAFRPYLLMYTAQKDFVPWVASQSDLLAEDWEVVQ